jgi:hypothetical protein
MKRPQPVRQRDQVNNNDVRSESAEKSVRQSAQFRRKRDPLDLNAVVNRESRRDLIDEQRDLMSSLSEMICILKDNSVAASIKKTVSKEAHPQGA